MTDGGPPIAIEATAAYYSDDDLDRITIEFGDEPRAEIGDAGGPKEDDRPNDQGVPVGETHNGPPNYPPPEVPEELLPHGPNQLDLDSIDLAPIVVAPLTSR